MEFKNQREKGEEGEEFVNSLAFKSFIKYWCYPSPEDEDGDRKEIADLLILFKDICIIISVKNYEYKGNDERYFKKTVLKAVKQIEGAERKLFTLNRDIYIKHPNREKERFNKHQFKKIYRLILNVGGEMETPPTAVRTAKNKEILVFHRESFEQIIQTSSTLSDFCAYFDAKILLFKAPNKSILLGAELDLFSTYLDNNKAFPLEYFTSEYDTVVIDCKGEWQKYLSTNKESLKLKNEEEKTSLALDSFLEKYLLTIENGPTIASEIFSLNRFERRILSNQLFDFIRSTYSKKTYETALRCFEFDEVSVTFLFCGDEIIEGGQIELILQSTMIHFLINQKFNKEILLGFIIDSSGDLLKTHLVYKNQIDEELIKQSLSITAELNYFTNVEKTKLSIHEMPKLSKK